MAGPRDIEDYYEQYRDRVIRETDRLPGDKQISSFSQGPPSDAEYALFHDVIARMRWQIAHEMFATKLSGYANWAGRFLTEDDVPEVADTFGIDPAAFSVSEYNKHVELEDLDEWALGNGVRRIPAARATGEVTIFVREPGIAVEEGTVVSTNRQEKPVYEYVVQATRRPERGSTTIENVPIEARFGGPEYNVGPGSVTDTPRGASGFSGLTNTRPISGGEVEETQPEFRRRARRVLEFGASGTTEQGIVGEIYREYNDQYGLETDDIKVIEHPDPNAPDNELGFIYADVYVDGGPDDATINEFLEDFDYPVLHRVQRPTNHPLEITAVLRPEEFARQSDISVQRAQNYVLDWISEFGIGDSMSVNKLQYHIMRADPEDIGDIDSLTVVDGETGETTPPGADIAIPDTDQIVASLVEFETGPRDT